jgi:hypothetical protein
MIVPRHVLGWVLLPSDHINSKYWCWRKGKSDIAMFTAVEKADISFYVMLIP